MKNLIFILIAALNCCHPAFADSKISNMTLGSASGTVTNDAIPYYDSVNSATKKLLLSDLINLPTMQTPTFGGTVTAPTFVGALTGTASGNFKGTASNHGMLISGSANTVTVLAPDSSTAKVWISGGTSADPGWGLLTNSNLTGSAAISNANLATMSANTVKANATGSTATPTDVGLVSTNTVSTAVFRDGSGNFSAGTISAALTGTASGNLTYSASNHGVVLSSSSNTATVAGTVSSTTAVFTSGGSSADGSYKEPQMVSDYGSGGSQVRTLWGYLGSAGAGNCTGTCSMNQTSGGMSAVRNSAGNYTITFSPAFSAAAVCTASCDITGTLASAPCGVETAGTSTVVLVITNVAGAATDGRANVICVGPK